MTAEYKVVPAADLPAVINGMMDVIFAFAVVLANRQLIEREDLARTLEQVVEQQRRQGIGNPEARHLLSRILIEALRIPVGSGLRVVDGGKSAEPVPDDPGPRPAA